MTILSITLSCSTTKSRIRNSSKPTQDSYWNDISAESIDAKARITDVIKENDPSLYNEMLLDSKDPLLPMFWGKSYNFDSGAKQQIVNESIIEDLQRLFNVKNDNKIVHAGIMHTYGYLFSTINTPYGYKRKRWIAETLNYAFDFEGNSLSPATIDGGLLSNVTYFSGMIALSDKTQLNAMKNVSSEIIAFDYSKLRIQRVDEITKDFILTTNLVKLPKKQDKEENSYLLIYSVNDLRTNKELLITAFPVNTETHDKILAPETLGNNQKIALRYNVYIEGAGNSFTGTRKLIIK